MGGMTRDNFLHLLNGFLQRRPWKAFTVELVSGCRIEVNHPESIRVGREKDLAAIMSTARVRCYFEIAAVVRFLDATGVA
jgi:hypothetical protein